MDHSNAINYIIRLNTPQAITDYTWNGIDKITVGNSSVDTIHASSSFHLEFFNDGCPRVKYECAHSVDCLPAEDLATFSLGDSSISSVAIYEMTRPFAYRVQLEQGLTLHIGRAENDIFLPHKSVSRHHATIESDSSGYYIKDCNSTNGTYVNGTRVIRERLKYDDAITIGKYTLIFKGDYLVVSNLIPANCFEQAAEVFNRAPRMKTQSHTERISIQKPPSIGSKPEINWLSVLLPPILMALIVVVMAFVIGTGSTYMFIMLPMQLISVLIAIINYRKQTKSHNVLKSTRLETYHKYIDGIKNRVSSEAAAQLNALQHANPPTEECFRILSERQSVLWERRTADEDFAKFRIGIGSVKANVTAEWVKDELAFTKDELEEAAEALCSESQYIQNAPILVDASGNHIIGIAGEDLSVYELIRNTIIQAATFHSSEDLRIAVVFSEKDREQWQWLRWLPHINSALSGAKLLGYTGSSAGSLIGEISDILKERSENNRISAASQTPQYVVFVLVPELISNFRFLSNIYDAGSSVNISVIISSTSVNRLPKECETIIEVTNKKGKIYAKNSSTTQSEFIVDDISFHCEDYSRKMAPIKLTEDNGMKFMPDTATFMEGYHLKKIENYDIAAAWSSARTDRSLAVPIGIDESGNVFSFDIMDGKHGVHGLIGGMPGSGKSEMLQSWILSMALHFSPEDISFILIDFKGTGLITPFEKLPHLAGTISNIDSDIKRNLEALEYEIARREKLFDTYKVTKIKDYNRKANNGEIPEKIPIIFVVIDEFAEFKKTFPEFMKWVERSFAKGRSLGIWFILATQNPGADASPSIKENTHFKWCLKVASPASSKEMVGIPDASFISNPGRAYIKVSNSTSDFLTQVQSFWSGALYLSASEEKKTRIFMLSLNGARYDISATGGTVGPVAELSEIHVIVSFICRYAEANKIACAKKVWPDKLKSKIALNELLGEDSRTLWSTQSTELKPIVGEVDDPKHQRKFPLEIALSYYGHVAIYGAPSTGKTTFLQSLAMSIATMYAPSHVNLYMLDFGGLGLRVLQTLPHIGGIVENGDGEKLEKLAYMLDQALEERKRLFSSAGVGNMKAYLEELNHHADMRRVPYIVLMVDNFSAAIKVYPNLEPLFATLLQSGANYGIYCVLVSTGSNGISYKFQQNIKMSFALQLADKADYAMIVGRTEGLIPDNYIGRGLMKGNPPLQFQVALPAYGDTDSDISKNIRSIADDMSRLWDGEPALSIPVMPEMIPFGSIAGEGVFIGLSHESISPVQYDYIKQHFLMISGVDRDARINLLMSAAKQLKSAVGGKLVTIDTSKTSLVRIRDVADAIVVSPNEIDHLIEQLRPELQRRDAENGHEHEPFEPIIIVVDDFVQFYEMISNETANRIRAIVVKGSGMGIFFLTTSEAQALSILKNKGELATLTMVKGKQSVLLGGSLNDHPAFSPKATYSQKCLSVASNEGFLLNGSGFVRFKAMEL